MKLRKDSTIPTKNHPSDAGYDLYSCEDVELKPGQITKVDTGIALEIPEGYVGLVWDRSGHGSKGIKVFGGVIDSGYRGEITVCLGLMNTFERSWVKLPKGSKVAQILIQKVENFPLEEVSELSQSDRGTKGFGSSGI